MKTVLPQNTGAIEWGGVAPAIMIAIGLVLLAGACLWGWDCYRLTRRSTSTSRKPCSDEDQFLDALAMEVDRRMEELARRRSGPAEVAT